MTTIPVTVHVEFEDAGCGENCYALNYPPRAWSYRLCKRYKRLLYGYKKFVRCAECLGEFGE